LIAPGLVLASAMNSVTDFAGSEGLTASTLVMPQIIATPSKSAIGSNGNDL